MEIILFPFFFLPLQTILQQISYTYTGHARLFLEVEELDEYAYFKINK